MSRPWCDMTIAGRWPCGQKASYLVAYLTDGSGGANTCKQHLPRAIDIVLRGPYVGSTATTVRVARLGGAPT